MSNTKDFLILITFTMLTNCSTMAQNKILIVTGGKDFERESFLKYSGVSISLNLILLQSQRYLLYSIKKK